MLDRLYLCNCSPKPIIWTGDYYLFMSRTPAVPYGGYLEEALKEGRELLIGPAEMTGWNYA